MNPHSALAIVTARIIARFAPLRRSYPDTITREVERSVDRGRLDCGSLAHGFAASGIDTPAIRGGETMNKFFPAMAADGRRALKTPTAPLAVARFCLTEGVSPDNAGEYLAIPQLMCVGGGWMVRDGVAVASAVKDAANIPHGR